MSAHPEVPAQRSSMFVGLQLYPSFRLLWFSTVLTFLGQWMKNIALGWHMLVLTDSAFWVGMIAFASGIPFLIFALPAGVLLDRADERKVLLFTQWSSMIVSAVLAFMILFDVARPWHLLIAAAISGTIMALNQTVRQTLVPALVSREHMANAVALNSAGGNAMRIIGPSIAGLVIATLGVAACFFIQAGALLAALGVSLRIKPLAAKLAGVATGGILDGWHEVRKRPALGALLVLTTIPSVLVFPYMQLMPVFARDVLDIGPRGLGLLMAASGLGALTGALIAATMDRVQRKGLAVMGLTIVYCAAVAGFAASPIAIFAMLGLFIAGVTGSIFGSLTSALMLLLTDARVRGRVMAIYMLTNGFTPFGAIALGALAQRYGAPWAVSVSCALATVITAVAATRMKSLRLA